MSAPTKKPDAAAMYGVTVHEPKVLACGGKTKDANRTVADWWVTLRPRWEMSSQLRVLKHGAIVGDLIELGPFSKDDAEFARDHMVEQGVPQSALKVRTWKPAEQVRCDCEYCHIPAAPESTSGGAA